MGQCLALTAKARGMWLRLRMRIKRRTRPMTRLTHSQAVAIARGGEGAVVASLLEMGKKIDELEAQVKHLTELLIERDDPITEEEIR
jgi:hypothetical protein